MGQRPAIDTAQVALARNFTVCFGVRGHLLIPAGFVTVHVPVGFLAAAKLPAPRLDLGYHDGPLFPGAYIDMSFLRPQMPTGLSTPPSFGALTALFQMRIARYGAVQRKLQREGVIGAADADGIFRWLVGSETRVYSMKPLEELAVLGELRTREVRRYTEKTLDMPVEDLTVGVQTLTWLVPVCHADCVCLHRPSFVSRGDWMDIGGCDYNEILAVVPLMDTAANPLAFVPRLETFFDASGEANVAALFYGRRILLFAFRPVAEKERLLLYDGW